MSDFEARPFELTAKDTEGKVKEITQRLETGVRELFESERYQDYLKAMSKFHDYSLNNTLLIVMQKPDATLVAGFNKWRNEFERHVKRGEKGIKILAPAPYKIKKEQEKLDPDGKPIIGEDGKPVTEQKEITIPAFKVVSVFDVSQTDGKEIPDIAVDSLTGSVEQYEDFFKALEQTSPVPVGFERIDSGAHGYYSLADKRIVVDEGMSELQTIKTLIHEIAHAKLHDIDLNAPPEELENLPNRRTREVQAESVAYTVCQHFGLDTSDYSFGYVAGWSSDKDIKELKASLETIRSAVSELITEIEEHLQELLQQRETAQPVFEHIPPEQQQAIRDEVQATLQMLVDTDMQISGEVSQGTLDALAAQGYVLQDGQISKAEHEEVPPNTEPPEQNPPSITPLTDLQKKAVDISKKYDGLPMQDKIDMIAQCFGSTTGKIETSPCSGKWRGTSDVSIRFDTGTSLFIGNQATRKAKTKAVQQELVNTALVQYNPEIIDATKETALAALMEREAKDNAIAAERGLQPYTLLGVEFNDGTDDKINGYMGWYYVTLAVDGKICSHIETGLNHDIAAGRVSAAPTRENYYTAGALKESDIDYVFNNVGFSSTSALYSLHISDAVRERAEQALSERNAAAELEKELPPSLDPAVQPVVTIIWSESDKLQNGEQLPLARADVLFKALDEEKRTEREKPGYTGGWYDKTKFRIDCTFDGERDSYEGRQDFGDGDGSLIDHIQAYHEYYANDENWRNYVLHNQGAESWEQDKAEREMILSEFVPYMRLHCNLSEQERTAAGVLENGENLTPEQTAYFNAVLAHVDVCREKLNAGEYHLPDPPQLVDFDSSLQAYKAYVEDEIAQEAAAAGMTVEEYAANGYESMEQPADTPEQLEAAAPEEAIAAQEETVAVKYYPINESAARRANDMNSYRDYAQGSATAEYRQMVDDAAALAQQQKERVDPMYHEKIDALLDTYSRKLADNLNAHYAIEARVPSILVAGGSNFPTGKKHKQNAARDRNMQEWQDIQGILDKIRSTGMGGISMDDPQAAAKLEAKLDKLVQAQETMKAVNAYFRKHKTLDGCPHLTQEQIDKLKTDMAQSWHLDKSRPYQSYVLSNNNAEIRRIRARIEQIRQHKDTQFAGWEFDGGRVEANKADNRLQIFFEGKPDEGTRDELKANGFRWAPSVGAWQRQLNMNAYRAAEHISCIQPVTGDNPVDLQRSAQQAEPTPNAHLTGEQVVTPRGSFHVTSMTREQMEAAGYGYHHSSEDGKYLIMGNGTQAYAIAAEQREPENYMRTAELTTEQNYNMIDGRINNTPSVDELEEKAKRGEVISLSALAAAVKAEDGRTPQRSADGKKPSIRAQLKADRTQAAAKPKKKEKEQEAKRSVRQALEME